MSIALMAEVWRREIASTEQAVLLILCDHAHDDGSNCYPSVALIAWKLGVSTRTVQRVIKQLDARGVIRVMRREGKSSVYKINLDALPKKSPLTQLCHPSQDVTPDIAVSPHPRHSDVIPTPDIAVSPKPPVEPKEEPSKVDQPRSGALQLVKGTNVEPRKPMPRHGMAQTLLATLHEDVLRIGPPTDYGRAVKDAQRLADAGCTPYELREIAEWLLADPFWSGKGITIKRILDKRDDWRSAKIAEAKKPKKADANGGLVYG